MFPLRKFHLIAFLFALSGLTALVYEIVWIRLFSIYFGSTAQAMSTVLAIYLAGLAAGATGARSLISRAGSPLRLYGIVEILTGLWAALVPRLLVAADPLLRGVYADGHGSLAGVLVLRAATGALAVFPATVMMGATLPLLAAWMPSRASAGRINVLYSLNLAGATAGALLSGFAFLPALGFQASSIAASVVNLLIGAVAIIASRADTVPAPAADSAPTHDDLPSGLATTCAFASGFVCLLFEVVFGRVYGLILGPTSSTVTLILGIFLAGLTIGGVIAAKIRATTGRWLPIAFFAATGGLIWSIRAAASSPEWVAGQVRLHNASPPELELMKLLLLAVSLLPLTIALGLVFPLSLRGTAGRVGGLYSINTFGCIAGSLLAGWVLIPHIGTETALMAGGGILLAAGLAIALRLRVWPRPILAAVAATVAVLAFFAPRWDMAAMSAGTYKYAPYYADAGTAISGAGELVSINEGLTATVAVKKSGASLVLAIDGKIDASDSGGDLLTEKLLAHLPLLLAPDAKSVCLIGLASGVTAGAALTHPLSSLDVVELSPEVVAASHYFDAINRKPLADPRTSLILNDGRNHLALTSTTYDVIVSEPSNPWIAGMNGLFTRDFFRVARARLRPGGLFAQWFHIYNMPDDDLRSLLGSFTDVFPTATLWKLNDGDVLLTGFVSETPKSDASPLPPAAAADLAASGITDPNILFDFYLMRDKDIVRFAAAAPRNTDDFPLLEFHGQRDLHAQTDSLNESALRAAGGVSPPDVVARARGMIGQPQRLALGRVFEKAESLRTAFGNYSAARELDPSSIEAIAGMDRCATLPEQHRLVGQALGLPATVETAAQRTAWARAQGASGNVTAARLVLEETALASPADPAASFNSGVFALERRDYRGALEAFNRAIAIDPKYLPAFEATAQAYAEMRDFGEAEQWTRRILEIDPSHEAARRSLAALAGLRRPGH